MAIKLQEYKSRIEELEAEIVVLKSIISEEHLAHYNCVFKQNARLREENREMKEFLGNYGLNWVNKQRREGEFRLEALVRDFMAAEKDSLLPKGFKVREMTDSDLME